MGGVNESERQPAESVSVSDVMMLAERSTPEHLFWAFQTALGRLIDSHYEKEPADLPACLASLQRALVNGPTWKQAAQTDGDAISNNERLNECRPS